MHGYSRDGALAGASGAGIFIVDTAQESPISAIVRRWGNSLAVRIPKAHADELGLDDGTPVRLSVVDGKLVLEPGEGVRYDLAALLRGVTRQNRHRGVDTGRPVGRESW